MIVIVDYGLGNLASVRNMFKRLGIDAAISSEHTVIKSASKLILPGVGAFDEGMIKLRERGLVELLNKRVLEERTPVLGICLGMQLLTRGSEEGSLPGLGWIDAETKKFSSSYNDEALRIPHMGWNTIKVLHPDCPLTFGIGEDTRYYFVHSYHVYCRDPGDILASTQYGGAFTSMVWRGGIFGAQFHPEKSHKFGMAILKNFADLCGESNASN